MNAAHFHLIVNHLPLVGILIATLLLLAGLLFKKSDVKLSAMGVFIFSALAAIAANFTGEGAEEIVENLPGISETLIHIHEEYAESFFVVCMILGVVAALSFIAEYKKMRIRNYLIALTFLLAIAASVLGKYVGTSGGEIRHTEIRSEAQVINIVEDHD